MNSLSDRILFDWWYPVAMFPAWVTQKHRHKAVRFAGLLLAFPWFALFLPLTVLVVAVCIPLMMWEDV